MSGRELGKMPVLMFANHIQRSNCTLEEAVTALERCVEEKLLEKKQTNSESKLSPTTTGESEWATHGGQR